MGLIVFSGGAMLTARMDAETLLNNLSRLAGGGPASAQGLALPPGFVDVETEDGVVYVNPSQVAYVRDEPERPPVMERPVNLTVQRQDDLDV